MNYTAKVEQVIFTAAFGRVLAKDLVATGNVPKHNTSHMDGYAVNSSDITGASKESPVTLTIRQVLLLPSHSPKQVLGKGEAVPVATGSYLPKRADTVIPLEDVIEVVEKEEENNKPQKRQRKGSTAHGRTVAVVVQKPLPSGSFVRPIGSDIIKGELLLSRGTILRTQDIGLLASLGSTNVSVFARPEVAVIPTGNEITDDIREIKFRYDKGKKKEKILNTNSHVIARLIEGAGAISYYDGIASDNSYVIATKIRKALKTCSMVITIGGSSAGRFDLVKTAINSLGKPGVIAHGIRVDRGRVTGAGIIEGKPIITLPGPIQGAMSGFIVLALPLIQRISEAAGNGDSGSGTRYPLQVTATLTKDWHARKRFPNFTKVVYISLFRNDDGMSHDGSGSSGGELEAEPLQAESESMRVLVRANAYILVPEHVTSLSAGQKVNVNLLLGFSF